jgi:hypothetical protein
MREISIHVISSEVEERLRFLTQLAVEMKVEEMILKINGCMAQRKCFWKSFSSVCAKYRRLR